MKNTVQIVLTALAATILLAGCDRNACKATYDGASGFGFASGVVNVEVSEEDRNSIRIPVARGSEDTDLASIGFEYDISGNNSADPVWAAEDPDGVFSLTTGNVVFAEGAYTAYALIRFNDINKLGDEKKNSLVSTSRAVWRTQDRLRKRLLHVGGAFSFRTKDVNKDNPVGNVSSDGVTSWPMMAEFWPLRSMSMCFTSIS